jgi:hypothetical protein
MVLNAESPLPLMGPVGIALREESGERREEGVSSSH